MVACINKVVYGHKCARLSDPYAHVGSRITHSHKCVKCVQSYA